MKLMTKEIEKAIAKYPLYSQDGKGGDAKVIMKIFDPMGRATWYILEGQRLPDGDYDLYGLCDVVEPEFGYVRLSEIESLAGIPRRMNINGQIVKVRGLPMERDISISPGKERLRDVYEATTGQVYPFDRTASYNRKKGGCDHCTNCGACRSANAKGRDPKDLLDKELYYLEKDRNGKVWIHVNGYVYEGEEGYKVNEYVGLLIDPERMRREGSKYYDEAAFNTAQYGAELDEEQFRAEMAGYIDAKPLRMTEVTDDMPIDGQWYYAQPYIDPNVKKGTKNKGQKLKERPAFFSKWRHKE